MKRNILIMVVIFIQIIASAPVFAQKKNDLLYNLKELDERARQDGIANNLLIDIPYNSSASYKPKEITFSI